MPLIPRFLQKTSGLVTSLFILGLVLAFLAGAAYSLEPGLNYHVLGWTIWISGFALIGIQILVAIVTHFNGRLASWREEPTGFTFFYLYKLVIGVGLIALVIVAVFIMNTA
ncbi:MULTISPECIES: hypothetical protein [unclassified Mycoplasma]|uniref:hypothetical protein n=1 Tax=unclassified Mycoplasma TaxID=2683645 RepID=UPI000FDD7CAF